MLEEGRPSVQHRLILHPVIVEEEERLLTFFFKRQCGAIAPWLVHLQDITARASHGPRLAGVANKGGSSCSGSSPGAVVKPARLTAHVSIPEKATALQGYKEQAGRH